MTLSAEDINQILDEMNKKCVVSNDGNEETAPKEIEKTMFEKIASNITIMLIVVITLISMTYLFPPFFKKMMEVSPIIDKYMIYMVWNAAFTLLMVSYALMGFFQNGIYLVVFMFMAILFVDLIVIVNYNSLVLLPGAMNYKLFNVSEFFTSKESGIFFGLSIFFLVLGNLAGHLTDNARSLKTDLKGLNKVTDGLNKMTDQEAYYVSNYTFNGSMVMYIIFLLASILYKESEEQGEG